VSREADTADYFIELPEEKSIGRREEIDVQETVLEGLEPVAGTVYHLSNVEGAERVRPTKVAEHLYKRDAESLPESFGSDLNSDTYDKLERVNLVLEHGVSMSENVRQMEKGSRSLYDISDYGEEDLEELLEAAELAEISMQQARFWGVDESVREPESYRL